MKKSILIFLILCLTLFPAAASASPAAHSAYRLSFEGHMAELCAEPIGRWMDELMELITLRAELISWDGGSATRVDFLVNGAGAASLAVFELQGDLFLSGNLFPEMPRLVDEGQQIAAYSLTDALFPSMKSAADAAETEVTAGEFMSAAHTFADFLRLASSPDDPSSDAFPGLLTQLADTLSVVDPNALAVRVVKTPDLLGTPTLPDASGAAGTAVERLLRALMIAISEVA